MFNFRKCWQETMFDNLYHVMTPWTIPNHLTSLGTSIAWW
jgi:hypothetical protein